jgi:peptide/nickel transport system permease protein
MGRFLLLRLVGLVPVLIGMSLLLFLITHALPADPVRAALGQDATEEQVIAYRRELRLDESLPVQYVSYMSDVFLHGDLGNSIVSRRPVLQDLLDFFPATVELAAASILFSLAVSVPLGIGAAVFRGSWLDHASRITSLLAISMPVFWLGLVLQLILYAKLGILPFGGRLDSGLAPPPRLTGFYTIDSLAAGDIGLFINVLQHLVMPAVVLSSINIAILARIIRSSLLDVLLEGYITTAHAKGLARRTVISRHALKNASIPIVTIAGLRFGELLGGAVLTETVFAWPGIGRYAVFSITRVDFPALMGVAWVATLIYALLNVVVDVSYGYLDPRVRR